MEPGFGYEICAARFLVRRVKAYKCPACKANFWIRERCTLSLFILHPISLIIQINSYDSYGSSATSVNFNFPSFTNREIITLMCHLKIGGLQSERCSWGVKTLQSVVPLMILTAWLCIALRGLRLWAWAFNRGPAIVLTYSSFCLWCTSTTDATRRYISPFIPGCWNNFIYFFLKKKYFR